MVITDEQTYSKFRLVRTRTSSAPPRQRTSAEEDQIDTYCAVRGMYCMYAGALLHGDVAISTPRVPYSYWPGGRPAGGPTLLGIVMAGRQALPYSTVRYNNSSHADVACFSASGNLEMAPAEL